MAQHKKTAKPVAPALVEAMKAHQALATSLDSNKAVRELVLRRLVLAANKPTIPVAVLHLLTQTLEEY